MLKSFLCAESITVGLLIFDGVVLFLAIAGLVTWALIRNKKKSGVRKNKGDANISKVDDETYLIENPQEEPEPQVYENDNNVVHFVNQITDINQASNEELNANTVVVNHEVEVPVKKMVAKDEIANFVEVGGEKKVKTEEEIATAANRGSDAFKNATNFFNTIKSEQESDKMGSVKVSKKR